jgi:hypothetical protein
MSDATIITCPACGDAHAAPNGDADFLRRGISRCTLCDARIVYGELAPRVVVEPARFRTIDGSRPAFRVAVQDPKTKTVVHEMLLDPQHAFLLAQSIISMVRP